MMTQSTRPEGGPTRLGAAAAALALPGVLLLAPALSAQTLADYDYEHLAFRGIGLDVGYIWPNKVRPTTAWSARLDLGYLGPGVRIAPSLTYWRSSIRQAELDRWAERLSRLEALQDSGVEIDGADLAPVEWSDFSFSLDAHWVWIAPGGVLPYVGGGAALHVMNGRGPAIEDTFVEDLLDSFSAGLVALTGIEYAPWGRWFRVYGEARFTLLNNLRYPGVRAGGAFILPGHDGWFGHGYGRGAGGGSVPPAPDPEGGLPLPDSEGVRPVRDPGVAVRSTEGQIDVPLPDAKGVRRRR